MYPLFSDLKYIVGCQFCVWHKCILLYILRLVVAAWAREHFRSPYPRRNKRRRGTHTALVICIFDRSLQRVIPCKEGGGRGGLSSVAQNWLAGTFISTLTEIFWSGVKGNVERRSREVWWRKWLDEDGDYGKRKWVRDEGWSGVIAQYTATVIIKIIQKKKTARKKSWGRGDINAGK